MPEQWDVSRLGEKGSFQYGYTASATEENTGIKFLRITDIGNGGRVTWGDVPYVSLDRGSLQKFRLCPGELLFARIGATTGKTYLADRTTPEAVFASYLIRFNADDSIHPPYALYYTRTTRYWELVSAGKGGKLKKGLSATQLKSFALPVPPIAEQREIAAILSAVDHDTEIQDDKRKALEGLFRTLLNNLMAGKVRVVEQ